MSYRIYPVTESRESCTDYRVFINGEEAALNTARVSATPYNRRWPGHQRQIEQTELNNFLSFAMDGEVELTVIPARAFDTPRIYPREIGKKAVVDETGKITIKLDKPAYFTVESCGVHHALHVFADPMPAYEKETEGTEVLYFGRGVHDAGTIELKSNQTLFIDEGAVVYASVKVRNAENVKILGRGILDNSKNKEIILFERNEENTMEDCGNSKRVMGVSLMNGKNLVIDGITLRHSLVYNIDFASCENILVKNVKLIGNWRYNTDGIHLANCVNAEVADCFLRCYDDSICVRGYEDWEKEEMEPFGGGLQVTKNIRVHGCTIWNDWGKGMFIGAATQVDEICDVVFEDCTVIHPIHTVMDFLVVDYAYCHDIVFRNISVEYDDSPRAPKLQPNDREIYFYTPDEYETFLTSMFIVHHYEYSHDKEGNTGVRGKIEDIAFENIFLSSKQPPKIRCQGYSEEYAVRRIAYKNICWNGEPITEKVFKKHTGVGPYTYDIRLMEEE